jgi:molecular chaperone DnaJ
VPSGPPPGRHTAAEGKFKEINEAYRSSRTGRSARAYDRFGHAAFENGGGGGGNPDFSDFMSDIFDSFFGDARGGGGGGLAQRRGRERGADLRYNLEITLEEAFSGKNASIRVPTSIACEVCAGHRREAWLEIPGARPAAAMAACAPIRASSRSSAPARPAHGRGEIIDDPCKNCQGAGRVTRSARCRSTFRRASRTAPGSGLPARARPAFAADRRAISTSSCRSSRTRSSSATAPICSAACRLGLTSAALGGEIEVPTLDGEQARVKVPEGTQTGKQFRLKGKGMSVLRSRETGDLYIQVLVETPQKLTARQRELLEEFEKASSEDTNPESAGFFARIRDFFGGT